ncbi:MAG: NAD(P)H-hydrate dehydratase [Candidatus Nealsonbacteria bacterium]|nr:NAD(P)H-hydrate dehydratase [Candidatus Nealsonbacteria bacterium]
MATPTNSPLPLLPKRPVDAHKNDFGTALLVGGSRGMAGAVGLAGMAALRGGAGLVRLAVPDRVLETVAGFEPSYMTVPLADDDAGRISVQAYDQILAAAEPASVVAVGPGMGRSRQLDKLVGLLYCKLDKPMVFDADALNALATQPDLLARPGGPRILTPHPGEFTRLTAEKFTAEKLDDDARRSAAVEMAGRGGIVVVLKGRHTLITDGTRRATNTTGNPGMATGGSGDVLTGLIAAMVCQGLAPFESAQVAAHLHGLAGDHAAAELGEVPMIAADLLQFFPEAFAEYNGGDSAPQ